MQDDPFRNPDPFEPKRAASRSGWVLAAVAFAGALTSAAAIGYGLGRSAWALPGSLVAVLPAPVSARLSAHRDLAGPTPLDLQGFKFQLVDNGLKTGDAELVLRLVANEGGSPAPEVVIYAHRLDMAPEGMPTMTAALEPRPAEAPGVYRFKTSLSMEGRWRLSLAAKIQGEHGTLRNQLVFEATP